MKREQIIKQFTEDPEYKNICRQIAGAYADDLYQELALIVLEYPDDKLTTLNESCLKGYYYKMAERQFTRSRSAFFNKFRKPERLAQIHKEDILQVAEDNGPDEDLIRKMQKAIKEGYWYDQGILTLYIEKGTLQEVANITGIPLSSVHDTIKNFKKIIRKKVKKYE